MAKKVQITMVEVLERNLEVTYETGTVRKYPTDKIPGTVKAWMDAHPTQTASEQAEEEWLEAVSEEDMDLATFNMTVTNPGLVLVPMEPAQLPAVVETEPEPEPVVALVAVEATEEDTTEEVTEEVTDETAKTTTKTTGIDARKAGEVALNIIKVIGASVPAVGVALVGIAKALVVIGAWLLDKMVSGYYLTTTYLPIWARYVARHTIWAVQDIAPTVKRAAVAAWDGVRAGGAVVVEVNAMVAGWVVAGIVVAGAVAVKACKVAADGWKLREELVNEYREAA